VSPRRGSIEGAVPGHDEDIASGIRRRATATLPDASPVPIGSRVENADLSQGLGIIREHPSEIRVNVTQGGKGKVDRVIAEAQRGALEVFERVTGNRTIDPRDSISGGSALDHHRRDLISAGGHV